MKIDSRLSAAFALLCGLVFSSGCGSASTGASPISTAASATPQIRSLSPATVSAGAASFTLTITGSGFESESTVQVGGTSVQATVVSATEIVATVPPSAVSTGGALAIVVSNGALSSSGGAPAVDLVVDNPPPAITSLSPANTLLGSPASAVTITGSGFNTSSIVQVNGTNSPAVYVSATQMTWSPIGSELGAAGNLSLTISNPAPGGGTSSALPFTVDNPTPVLTALNPSSFTAGSGTSSFLVTGTGFLPSSTISLNGSALSTTFVSATQLKATVPAAATATAGTGTLIATNPTPGGGTSAALSFTVTNPAPTLATVSPSSIVAGSGALTLNIIGTGFSPSSILNFDGSALPTLFVSATELKATVPASATAAAGTGSVTAMTPMPGGGTSSALPFTVNNPVPALTTSNPASLTVGSGALTIDIIGSGFNASSSVNLNGSALTSTFVSATELKALLPSSAIASGGTAALTATNPSPGGGTSSALSLPISYAVPTIISISPANMLAGAAAVTLDIKGTGFSSATTVSFNGQVLTSAVVNSTEITAVLPTSALAASSANQVNVLNPAPGGGASPPITFNVNSPTPILTGVSPRNVATGSPATVTLTGSGFEANSVVQWNGVAHAPTVISNSSLTAVLTAADLASSGTGSLVVVNPAPNGASSAPVSLNVTSSPIPSISGVAITAPDNSSSYSCPQLVATFTGANLSFGSPVQVNGTTIGRLGLIAPNAVLLPVGLVAQPGALTFTVISPSQSTLVSDPFSYPATAPTVLSLCAAPRPTTVFPSSSFSLTVTPSEVNATGNETVAVGTLPAGITASTNSVPLSATGTQLHFQSASTTAAGTYTIPLTGTAGTATGSGSIALTVSTSTVPGFSFATPTARELEISPGTSGSLVFTTSVNSPSSIDYDITPSVSGLPAGVTATFSPSTFSPGQSVTATLAAGATAPLVQNVTVTLTGTPSSATPPVSVSFLLDVSQPPGSLPTSRTDFTPIAGTPDAAAYDATHGLIFASNPSWNRIDVLSATTHQVVKHIPVYSPRGIDITQDYGTVWVQTAGQYLYAINTSTLQATQYSLPDHTFVSSGLPTGINTHDVLFALSDGTLFVYFDDAWAGGSAKAGVFNPQTGKLNVLTTSVISAWTTPVRSGDGTRVYATNSEYGTGMEVYDVASKTLQVVGSGTSYGLVQAVNRDGSVIILSTFQNTTYGSAAYSENLAYLGSLPCGVNPAYNPLNGGILFSADGKRLYAICAYEGQSLVLTLDPQTYSVLGTAPSMFTDPVATSGYAGTSSPFGVDATGLIFGLQNYGVAFEDSTFTQNYVANLQEGNGEGEYISTFAGPLAGGTAVEPNAYSSLIPDVWFGQTRGTVQSGNAGSITAISPPSTVQGVVNLKYNFPDGIQWFYPQLFSYGTNVQYAVTSGSSPNGGAAAQLLGYGLPASAGGGTVTVGGNNATITTTQGQYPPLSGEPYPSTLLAYTLPAGKPGWADLQVTTSNGTGTLPKSIFYADSVTDYASSDTFTNVLYDKGRNQLYLSAGDHIDVFSLASKSFVSPLTPASLGANRQFTGLALTPDGTKLLAADLLDGSLAIIEPDSPSTTSAIAIATPVKMSSTCTQGPLYVAAAAGNTAFVSIGGLPGPACPSYGLLYSVNLETSKSALPAYNNVCNDFTNVAGVDTTADGSTVFMPTTGSVSCLYSQATRTYTSFKTPTYYGDSFGTISARGNVLFNNDTFGDSVGDALSTLASPIPYYGSPTAYNPPLPLLRPRLNTSGSLLYAPYANWVDIIDVAHASLRLRFALTETISSTAGPIAIDSGGQTMFLITNNALTVVDLGAAPLSIGSVSQQTVGVGSQVTLLGSGFDAQTTAKVGGAPALVTFIDQNTLTLTIPAAPSGPQDVILTRGDATTYTLENAIVVP